MPSSIKTKKEQAEEFLASIPGLGNDKLNLLVKYMAGDELCQFFKDHVAHCHRLHQQAGVGMDVSSFMLLGYLMGKLEREKKAADLNIRVALTSKTVMRA